MRRLGERKRRIERKGRINRKVVKSKSLVAKPVTQIQSRDDGFSCRELVENEMMDSVVVTNEEKWWRTR